MKSFEEAYKDNIKAVFAYLMATTGDVHLSEELTQEAFYRAYRAIKRFRGDCKLSVWLCQIAKHCLLDHQKKASRHVIMADVAPVSQSPSAETVVGHKETMRQLELAISLLPSPYKEVFIMHHFGQMPLKEIAQLHDKTDSWARVTCFRAKEKLREALKGTVYEN